MNAPHPMQMAAADVQAISTAIKAHANSMAAALRAYEVDTHPMKRPSAQVIEAAIERYRIAYNASLRVYLGAVRELDDRR